MELEEEEALLVSVCSAGEETGTGLRDDLCLHPCPWSSIPVSLCCWVMGKLAGRGSHAWLEVGFGSDPLLGGRGL